MDLTKKPRGRAPNGKVWENGVGWVDKQDDMESPKEETVVVGKEINNDKVVEAEIDYFKENESMYIFMATNKVHMKYNGRVYVGNAFGMEFTTPGPQEYKITNGRGF